MLIIIPVAGSLEKYQQGLQEEECIEQSRLFQVTASNSAVLGLIPAKWPRLRPPTAFL